MLEQVLIDNHGIVSRAQLLACGIASNDVRALVRRGSLAPVRRGWYSGPTAQDKAKRAIRAGGAVSCVSALALHGVWTPPARDLHIRRSRHFADRKLAPGLKDCQPIAGPASRISRPVDSLGQALLSALACVDAETAVAMMDSALHLRLITLADLEALVAHLPGRKRALIDRVDANAESGTESLVRHRLRSRRIKVRTQVEIPTVGRVDLLVGDRLVLEVDSVAHHTSAENYRRDRARDRRLVALGYIVIRLTYEEVMTLWPEVELDILALVRAGKHKRHVG